jgi:hypothetical protein
MNLLLADRIGWQRRRHIEPSDGRAALDGEVRGKPSTLTCRHGSQIAPDGEWIVRTIVNTE